MKYNFNDPIELINEISLKDGSILPIGIRGIFINEFDDGNYQVEIKDDDNKYTIIVKYDDIKIDNDTAEIMLRQKKSRIFRFDDVIAIKSLKGKRGIVTGIGADGKVAVKTKDMKEEDVSIYFEPSDLKILERKYGDKYFPYISKGFQKVIYRSIFKREFPILIYDDFVIIDRSGFNDLLHDARYYTFLQD